MALRISLGGGHARIAEFEVINAMSLPLQELRPIHHAEHFLTDQTFPT